jgi:hypothetical protein
MLSSDRRRDRTQAVQVTCILLSERKRHLCCVASDRGIEKKNLFRNDLLRHCQIPVGGGTVHDI